MILLDTNVLSEALKPAPDGQVVAWLNRHFPDCALSSIVLFELLAGVALLAEGARRDMLQNAIDQMATRFGSRFYAFDAAAAQAAASLLEIAKARGLGLHQIPAKLADLQVAGIAFAHGLTLATRNVSDFQGAGLNLINPWEIAPR